MPRSALIGSVLVGLALTIPATPQNRISCSEAHKSYLDKLATGAYGKLSPERLAAERRKALRIYHACLTGDVDDAGALFRRLEGGRY
jgi:hypothetical protein